MSLTPIPEENRSVVYAAKLAPLHGTDSPSWFRQFVNTIRTAIGLKPVHLAEQYARARISQIETDSETKLLEAKTAFMQAQAELEASRLNAAGQFAKDQAVAKNIEASTRLKDYLLQRLQKDADTDTALADVIETIDRIELLGGRVELKLPAPEPRNEMKTQ